MFIKCQDLAFFLKQFSFFNSCAPKRVKNSVDADQTISPNVLSTFVSPSTCHKFPKYLDTSKICCNHSKI